MLLTSQALASLALAVSLPQEEPAPALTPLAASIDAAATRAIDEQFVPGGAVALIEGGKVTLLRGYGVADSGTGAPVTPSTIFQIGSISKTVAAWGVMGLVEDDRLGLDAPIGSVVERWSLPESTFDASGVTIRRLLSHTGGLSVHGYGGFGPDETLPTIEESLSGTLQGYTAVELVAEPGSAWSYSGGGYTLLQLAVEEVSGQSFADFMTAEVLTPLGMTSSRYGEPIDPERFAGAHGASGEPVDSPRFTALAAAGIHTTLEDMVRFAQASISAKGGPLSEATIRTMQTAVPVGDQAYGLGYQCGAIGDHRWVGHGGSNMVWLADMKLIPETGDGLLVFVNSSRGSRLLRDVVGTWRSAKVGGAPPEADGKPSAAAHLAPILREQGIAAAKEEYARLRRDHRREFSFQASEILALGLHLLRTGAPDEGLDSIRWAIELKPRRFRYSRILGDAYERLGRSEEARAAWRVAADGKDAEAIKRLGAGR